MKAAINVIVPGGRSYRRERPEKGTKLARWLASEEIPLNTRCSGRGLCQGCQVMVDGSTVRACQTFCEQVTEVRIPEASLRDHRINGISSFEIRQHNYNLRRRPGMGLAIDIGTTTVALAIWDLQTGKCLGQGSIANEQRRFGDNVLSRIDHARHNDEAIRDLQSALIKESIEPLLASFLEPLGLGMEAIDEAVCAGNTVMQHTLTGDSLRGFAAYPFKPVFLEGRSLDSHALGFRQSFSLMLAPNLGPFVGADIAMGALASGMLETKGPALLIDFGTNGEILLKTRDGYLATATAAGPAFEGGRLSFGSAAGSGVVSYLQRESGKWKAAFPDTEKGFPARGISGAAYVDFMALAVRDGILNLMGRMNGDHPEVRTHEKSEEHELRVKIHSGLFITETDVAELIQAKAAISSGVMTLLELADLTPDDLEVVLIAGGFGYHLNYRHAMAVGMMPDIDPDKVRVIGNASLGGASLLLQSGDSSSIESLRAQCRIIELNQVGTFEDHYIDCMPLARIE